jgi:hypothetical protein
MKTRLLIRSGGLTVLMILGTALATARAQDADPPGRVARLSDVEGAVSLQPAGLQDWTAASLNRPLTTGDRLWSDQNSRAELDIGDAAIRLGSATGFSFLNLDDSAAQMQVTAGTLIVRVRDIQPNQSYEIDTPNLALLLQQPGEYRLEVNDTGDSTVVRVSAGAAQASGGGQTISISAQQSVTFTGTNPLAYDSAVLGAPDELDNWSAARERQREDSVSSEYVADDIPGTQDLDNNGRWQDTPEYGSVWMPTAVVVGWVPYRFGQWVWITPWGWTWVDDARWGYAPFHYGRWVQWNNAWCWIPGPRRVRPVYAPALVAWVGGPAVGATAVYASNISWFPLGPREVYVPAVGVSVAYLRNVNITNTTIVNNTYITNVYQRNISPAHYVNNRPAAVTSVPQNIFTSGQRVGGHAVQLPPGVLAGAAVAAAAPAIAPIRQSVLGPGEGRGVVRPPAALLQRPVVARTAPPRAPAPFDRQLAAIQAKGGRPLARTEIAQLQPPTPAVPVRVIAASGPVVAVPSRGRGVAAARPGNPPPAQGTGSAAASLAERERALQQNTLPPAPRAGAAQPAAGANSPGPERANTDPPTYAPRAVPSAPPATPQWRGDRPPSAEQHFPPAQPREFSSDDPTHAYGHPPPLPVYRPPVGPDTSPPTRESVPTEEGTRRAAPATPRAAAPPPRAAAPPPAPVPQQPVHPPPAPAAQQSVYPPPPPAPAHAQPAKEPRESAPHGDRDSRERVPR